MTVCSICGQDKDDGDYNNAKPVNSGRCCNKCNNDVVLPARIEEKKSLTNRVFSELEEMKSSPEKFKEKSEEINHWMLGFQKRLSIAEHLSKYSEDDLERQFFIDYMAWHAKILDEMLGAGDDSKNKMMDLWEDFMVELRDKFFNLMGSNERVDELLDRLKGLAENSEQGEFGACKVVGKHG